MQWQQEAMDRAAAKVLRTSARIGCAIPYLSENGRYNDQTCDPGWWTNGFWMGILWYCHLWTGEALPAQLADRCEALLDPVLQGFDRMDHDAGFLWLPSAGAQWSIRGGGVSRSRALLAASVLAARMNPQGGFIRAWNDKPGQTDRRGLAIIDCMMNLPLLYFASELTDDPRFRFTAMRHADTTLRCFIRPNGSVRHIVEFDPLTGEMLGSRGGQGYDAHSSWSRGTAWALYGFAASFHYTREPRYLEAAQRIAHFLIAALPDDGVPFADLIAPPELNTRRDTSAASCAASGLLLLAGLTPGAGAEIYKRAALRILRALDTNFAPWGEDEEALLHSGCVSFHNERYGSVPLIYGDYFFVEALAQLCGAPALFTLGLDTRLSELWLDRRRNEGGTVHG